MSRAARSAFVLAILLFSQRIVFAQPVRADVSLRTYASTESQLPFWFAANQGGIVDRSSTNSIASFRFLRPFNPDKKLSFSVGMELFGRVSDNSQAVFNQIFGAVRYGQFYIKAGRWEQMVGLVDSTMSVGSMTLSRNATPVPMIGIGFDYIPVLSLPGKVDLIYAKGFFGNGWLGNDRFVRGAYLHEKYLYLRAFGPPEFPVHAYGGLVHFVVWGGTHHEYGHLTSRARDFVDVVLALAGESGKAIGGEVVNALGNTVASYDFGLTVKAGGIDARAYRQFYIETSTAVRFRNPWDGLWGISLRHSKGNQLISGLLWEHVNTKKQGAKHNEGEFDGADKYYNNFLYQSGWTYEGQVLGLPLIFGDGIRPGVVNNIIVAHHFALEGVVAKTVHYKAFLTYSRNYGARDDCNDNGCSGNPTLRTPRRDQYSFLLKMTTPVLPARGVEMDAAVGFDTGDVYPNSVGIMLGIKWNIANL